MENNYYWCAQECLDDINLMFRNCYLYNKPGEVRLHFVVTRAFCNFHIMSQDVTIMAQSLEKFYLNKVKAMPPVEVELSAGEPSKKKGANINKTKKVGFFFTM